MGRTSGKHSKKPNIDIVIPKKLHKTSDKKVELSKKPETTSENQTQASVKPETTSENQTQASIKPETTSENQTQAFSKLKGVSGRFKVTSGKHGDKSGGRRKLPAKSQSALGKHDSRLSGGLPSSDTIKGNLDEMEEKIRVRDTVFRVLFGLSTAAAVAIIVAIVFLPILKIYGTSMTPSLYQSDIVISLKGVSFKQGDVISFYYNNNILVKRVIATEGDWVDIDDDGNVSVNGKRLDEPYVDALAKGNCDIELPYQVPDGCIFVMGDHRATSKDSRSTDVGSVTKDKVVGKIVFRIWPLNKIGAVE